EMRGGRRAVGVGGRNQSVAGRDLCMLAEEFLGAVDDRAWNGAGIDDRDRQPGFAVVERQTADMQLIVDLGSEAVGHAAGERGAERGSDVRDGGSGAQLTARGGHSARAESGSPGQRSGEEMPAIHGPERTRINANG